MTKLSTWMARNGLDDEAVAAEIGCSRVQINRLRRNASRPSPQLAMKLGTFTGIPWHEFIDSPEDEEEPQEP